MWRHNKCLFIIGITIISIIVVMIILGVVILMVAPALPQLKQTAKNYTVSLRTFEDNIQITDLNITGIITKATN